MWCRTILLNYSQTLGYSEFSLDNRVRCAQIWLVKTNFRVPRACREAINANFSISNVNQIRWYLSLENSLIQFQMSHDMTKPTKWLRAQRRQISLAIRPIWLESSLSAWRNLGSLATHSAHYEDWSDWANAQADTSLRWAHTHFVGFVMSWLKYQISVPCVFAFVDIMSIQRMQNRHRDNFWRREYYSNRYEKVLPSDLQLRNLKKLSSMKF